MAFVFVTNWDCNNYLPTYIRWGRFPRYLFVLFSFFEVISVKKHDIHIT